MKWKSLITKNGKICSFKTKKFVRIGSRVGLSNYEGFGCCLFVQKNKKRTSLVLDLFHDSSKVNALSLYIV
jgi:hypothetical protein